MKTVTLTIRNPQELAEVIKANPNLNEIPIEEGKVIIKQVGRLYYIYLEHDDDDDLIEVVNAYYKALRYELKRIGVRAYVY